MTLVNPPIEPATGGQITNPEGDKIPVTVVPKPTVVTTTTSTSGLVSTSPVIITPTTPPVAPSTPTGGATMTNHVWDITLRSLKTFLATFTATLTASGLDITHPSVTKQLLIAAISAGLTAVLNTGIKVYQTQN